ncbi:MAG TPA: hypothetical protein VF469_00015 [Kofleriaceae bacterium]
MRTKPWLMSGAIAAALSITSTAHAADWLTLLDWACDPNATNQAAVKTMVLTACDATEGAKAACAVVAGTPFACFNNQAVARNNTSCDSAAMVFQITTTTAQTFGWKVAGVLDVDAQYALFWKTAQECSLTPKTPVPTSRGGDYIFKAGEAHAIAIMNASGTGKITFLGGTVFSETVTKQCSRDLPVTAYKQATASECSGIPTPTPTASPAGTPSPSPTASATPPAPTPTVSATPPPTPTATATPPAPTPTATTTPLPTVAPTAPATVLAR